MATNPVIDQAIQNFQTCESLGLRSFTAAGAALGREFTTAERAAIRAFQKAAQPTQEISNGN